MPSPAANDPGSADLAAQLGHVWVLARRPAEVNVEGLLAWDRSTFLDRGLVLEAPAAAKPAVVGPEVTTVAGRLAAEKAPDVLLIYNERPGEWSPAELTELRRLMPLAGLVGVTGSWCEGQLRSGHAWPASTSWHWHEIPARWRLARREQACGRLAPWNQPSTWTEDERALAAADVPPGSATGGRVLVHSASAEMRSWLADLCQSLGYIATAAPAELELGDRPGTLLWDVAAELGPELSALCQAARRTEGTVVLLAFPRWQFVSELARRGVRAVLSKPLRLEDLAEALASVRSKQAPLPAAASSSAIRGE